MINYEWKFSNLVVTPFLDGKENIVNTVHWRLIGTNEDSVSGYVYGSVTQPYNPDSEFINYEDLTKELIEQWVMEVLGNDTIENYKQNIINQIQENVSPTNITMVAPWRNINSI